MRKTIRALAATSLTAAAALVALPALTGPAAAHISPDKDEVPAGSFNSVTLTVGHGCEDSPTNELRIQIPEGVTNVAPAVHPGWDIEVTEEELDEPIDSGEGAPITERVSEVTFTAQSGNELPSHFRDSFTIGFRTPDTPGEHLFFKTIQACEEGENAWVEEHTGEGEEPEQPAPALLVTEATDDGHGSDTDDASGEATSGGEMASGDQAAAGISDSADDNDETALAVAGIAVGTVGLVIGSAALLFAIRKTTPAASTDN